MVQLMGQMQPVQAAEQNWPGLDMVGKGQAPAPSLGWEGSAASRTRALGSALREPGPPGVTPLALGLVQRVR